MRNLVRRFFSWCLQKKEFNYPYFGLLLVFLSLLTVSHFIRAEEPLSGIPLFFLLHAIGQAVLEIGVIVLLSLILKRWALYLLIAFSFILQLLHFTDFTMVRVTDTSISFLAKFFFGSGIDHLIAASQALNLNPTMGLIIFFSLLLIPLLGLFFYWATHQIARKKPLKLSFKQILITVCATFSFLFLLDLCAHPFLNRLVYSKYQKNLPFGSTFLQPAISSIRLPQEIAPYRNEAETLANLPELTVSSDRPNLYLFVIETLRRDYVNEETAPRLTSFGQENIHFKRSFANGNSTHISWFSIFHSDFPYHWTHMRDEWKQGSIPLQMLKKLGYKIRIYSSADLRFFHMDRLLLGENRQLADHVEEFTLNRSIEPSERDALAIESALRDLPSAQKGNVFIFFLDATHSEYSIPKNFPLKFEPIVKEIDYLTISPQKKELEWVKNRYRNAIYYVDGLVGSFFDQLKQKGLYDEAIAAVTGDHGEEFFEEGALFHGTHLNQYQLSTPLFLKLPEAEEKFGAPKTEEATHMDLFPTILHYLTGQDDFSQLFDGQSIYSEDRWPYRIAVHQNGLDTPGEFIVQKEKYQVRARFMDPKKIYSLSDLEIIELKSEFPEKDLASQLEPDLFGPLLAPR